MRICWLQAQTNLFNAAPTESMIHYPLTLCIFLLLGASMLLPAKSDSPNKFSAIIAG